MVKLLKQSSISLLKTQGQRVDYKAQRTQAKVNDIQTKYWLTEVKDNIFLKPKMTERSERVDTFGGWIQRELKRFGKTVKMVETVQLGAISPRKTKKMQIEALKETLRRS